MYYVSKYDDLKQSKEIIPEDCVVSAAGGTSVLISTTNTYPSCIAQFPHIQ